MKSRITFALFGGSPRAGWLTTEHAASSYGLPVVICEGQAYSPAQVLWVSGGVAACRAAARAGYLLRDRRDPAR